LQEVTGRASAMSSSGEVVEACRTEDPSIIERIVCSQTSRAVIQSAATSSSGVTQPPRLTISVRLQ